VEGSWAEHLRHHHRVTQADAELQARVQAFHIGAAPPRVVHGLQA
jgi:Transmembrane secretion effector